jgi:hypothetical protein
MRCGARAMLLAGFVTLPCSCSGSEAGNDRQSLDQHDADCEGRGETLVRGMKKTSEDGTLEVSLTHASSLPPVQGENTWTVEVVRDGEPVLDAGDADAQVIANVYMAEHDHNIRKRGTMTEPGVFEFAKFPITMNGYWEITVQAQSDADADDREDVVFGFCVES